MDIVLLPQHWTAYLCICIMIGALVFAVIRKFMLSYALIMANFIIFIITVVFPDQIIGSLYFFENQIIVEYAGLGFRPLFLDPDLLPQSYTLLTSMFIHSPQDFLHILGNMFIFFFVGIPFEQRVGWKKFIAIYLIAGICGTLAHSLLNLEPPNNYITLIGASGAIFGIMGAFAFAYPRDEVVMPIPVGFFMVLRRIKVVYAVVIFAALETLFVFLGGRGNTAHFAHLGGLIGGFILAAILIRNNKKVDGNSSASFETTYYDSYTPQKTEKKDYSNLEKLANTPELKDILKRIKNETVPQVREIWLEHFVEKASCPKCGDKLFNLNNKISCEKCGFKIKY